MLQMLTGADSDMHLAALCCLPRSVLPSAEESKLEPEALYAEDVEQARHFYQVRPTAAT